MILFRATQSTGLSITLAAGAVLSIFSVILISLYGQSRIFYAMARDHVIPKALGRVDPKTGSPQVTAPPLTRLFPSLALCRAYI
jgi:APA family basic amino acid/polyamine antiporter